MRGEITFTTAAKNWGELRKSAGADALTSLPGGPLELAAHHKTADSTISASAAEWEKLKRMLALLESDLRLNSVASVKRGPSRLLLLPIVGVAFSVGIGWGLLFGWGLGVLFAGWLALGVITVIVNRRMRSTKRQSQPTSGDFAWYPFNDEQQWLAYADLLERFTLPEYSTAIHDRRLPSGITGIRAVIYPTLAVIGLCLMAIVCAPLYILLMPIFAFIMFGATEQGRRVAMTPAEMAQREAHTG